MSIPPPEWVSYDANKPRGLDLLGLRAPVQSIGNYLLNGLTSVTPKLRYLSVLTWIAWRYAAGRLGDDWPSFMRFAAAQEAAIVMANLIHDRTTSSLVGISKAKSLIDSSRNTFPLEALVRNIAFNIYASASTQLHLTFEKTDTGLYGLSKERGLPLAKAFDEIVAPTHYGSKLARQRQFKRVSRSDIEQLGQNMCLDELPELEKSILVDAIFPPNPLDEAERRRIRTLALLLWLSAEKGSLVDQSDLFAAACEPLRTTPLEFKPALDGWLDYQIRDVLAVTHEAVMHAVLEEVDSLSARRGAPALSSDVVTALLSATDEHDEALRQIGLFTGKDSVRQMSFAEVSDRVRQVCQRQQTFDNGLRRWRAGLSESHICNVSLSAGAGATALLPVAWLLSAHRLTSLDERIISSRAVIDIGDFYQIGLRAVVMPKLREFIRSKRTYLDVMAELAIRTVHQHLRVTWQRFAAQGQDVSVLIADLETWGRNNIFRAGQTESRLFIAIDWLRQLDLINEDGITTRGQHILDRALATLIQVRP